jgi:signal transduction histidine kinase
MTANYAPIPAPRKSLDPPRRSALIFVVTKDELIDHLATMKVLAGVPREQLVWIAEHGVPSRLKQGTVFATKGSPMLGFSIVLDGHLAIRVDRGSGPHKVLEWHTGEMTGIMPYSRMVSPPGTTTAEVDTDLLMIPVEDFPALIRDCYDVTNACVHVMIDRARHFTSNDMHEEKMASLGKLAAGLAHELNNPASAVARSAEGLTQRLADVESAARALGALRLTDTQQAAVDRARELCLASAGSTFGSSPLALADREDEITTWLERRHANVTAAYSLAGSSVTIDALDELAETLTGDALEAALRWLVAGCTTYQLASEIETAANKIYTLVAAVKGFTYMDQATMPKPVDVAKGLTDTLAVLNAKARGRSVSVTVEVEPDLPKVPGYGGELNQVFANLVDNALDVAKSGVAITANRQGRNVVVRVTDDGPGVPEEIRARIFDPFFTTKPVGKGTGLGLDIARRLVRHHQGEIGVESMPGHTQFTVTLPIDSGAS